ncbi:MAG: hypothetical protein IK015_02415 [Treponema sp.]|nr:hypothetical protein [Treponema sp.]
MQIKLSKVRLAPFVYLMQKIFFRMAVFSFMLVVSLALLYIAGNTQEFLDKSQAFILQSLIYLSITLIFAAILATIFMVLDSILSKFTFTKKIITLVFYIICIILSLAIVLSARTVLVLAEGTV